MYGRSVLITFLTCTLFYRQERAKRTEATPTKTNSAFSTVPITPTKASLESMSSVLEVIQADRDSVNHANKLTTIAQLYCACLEGRLWPYCMIHSQNVCKG